MPSHVCDRFGDLVGLLDKGSTLGLRRGKALPELHLSQGSLAGLLKHPEPLEDFEAFESNELIVGLGGNSCHSLPPTTALACLYRFLAIGVDENHILESRIEVVDGREVLRRHYRALLQRIVIHTWSRRSTKENERNLAAL